MASSSVAVPPDTLKLDWRKMNKQELRDALASRGLDTSGLRPLLIQRLESSLKPTVSVSPISVSSSSLSANASNLQASFVKSSVGKEEVPIASLSKSKNVVGKTQFSEGVPTVSSKDEERNGKILPSLAEEKKKDTEYIANNNVDVVDAENTSSLIQTKDAPIEKKSELNDSGGSNTIQLSDLDKKRKRAERFGVGLKVSEEEKLALRAERFAGAPGKKVSISESESEKRKQRAARFGIIDETMKKAQQDRHGTDVKQVEPEDAKRKARAERFGSNKQDSSKAKAS